MQFPVILHLRPANQPTITVVALCHKSLMLLVYTLTPYPQKSPLSHIDLYLPKGPFFPLIILIEFLIYLFLCMLHVRPSHIT
jgi:uncharacterized membrane protein YedE/YeeE